MCTVTWLRNDKGYDLLFNRDERHTRKLATVPTIREYKGVKFIAPTDGDHGGTWIAVNQFGMSLCLLNSYDKQTNSTDRNFISRGQIVMDLVDSKSQLEVKARLNDRDLSAFQPFRLFGISTERTTLIVEWDGAGTTVNDAAEGLMLLASSSFDTASVVTTRRKLYSDLISTSELTIDSLRSFHQSHIPFQSAYSVCMHREHARTVSYSEINVTDDLVIVSYFPDSPCLYSREKVQTTNFSLPLVRPVAYRQAKACTLNSDRAFGKSVA